MIEKDTRSLMSRVTDFAFGRWESEQTRRLGGTSSDSVSWLAGDGYRPRQSAASPKPSKMNGKSSVDRLLETKRPADPVKAAAVRMMLLSELWATDSKDPRVVSIFEADPVVVEDWGAHRRISTYQRRSAARMGAKRSALGTGPAFRRAKIAGRCRSVDPGIAAGL